MPAIINQLTNSNLSLDGPNGFQARTFGYFPQPSPIDGTTATALHRDFSIFGTPLVNVKDFNGSIFNTPQSNLDETDPLAPNNLLGIQIYKSNPGQKYKDLGPSDGRY